MLDGLNNSISQSGTILRVAYFSPFRNSEFYLIYFALNPVTDLLRLLSTERESSKRRNSLYRKKLRGGVNNFLFL